MKQYLPNSQLSHLFLHFFTGQLSYILWKSWFSLIVLKLPLNPN